MKTVYTCFCTDVIHEGHVNLLKKAREHGEVTVGILADEAMVRFNRFPTVSLESRIAVVQDTGLADHVIVQREIMYDKVLGELRPDYVIHGDNWKEGPERESVRMCWIIWHCMAVN